MHLYYIEKRNKNKAVIYKFFSNYFLTYKIMKERTKEIQRSLKSWESKEILCFLFMPILDLYNYKQKKYEKYENTNA